MTSIWVAVNHGWISTPWEGRAPWGDASALARCSSNRFFGTRLSRYAAKFYTVRCLFFLGSVGGVFTETFRHEARIDYLHVQFYCFWLVCGISSFFYWFVVFVLRRQHSNRLLYTWYTYTRYLVLVFLPSARFFPFFFEPVLVLFFFDGVVLYAVYILKPVLWTRAGFQSNELRLLWAHQHHNHLASRFMLCHSPCLPWYWLTIEQLYPYECQERLVDIIKTGDEITVDLSTDTLTNHASGEKKRPFQRIYASQVCTGSVDHICNGSILHICNGSAVGRRAYWNAPLPRLTDLFLLVCDRPAVLRIGEAGVLRQKMYRYGR